MTRWLSTNNLNRFALLTCVFLFPMGTYCVGQESAWLPTQGTHAWTRFGVRAWKEVRIRTTTFDENGKPSEPVLLFEQDPKMPSSDGMEWCSEDKCFYVSDMLINAVQKVDLQGNVTTIHSNGDTDGADGSLDQPCEVLVRGRELIVINMDMWWDSELLVNTKIDKPYTISVIDLD